jgi:hypothetical protein
MSGTALVAAWLFAALHLFVPVPLLALASALVLFLFVVPAALARRRDGTLEGMDLLALAPLSIAAAAALRVGLVTWGAAPAVAARATSIAALLVGLRRLWKGRTRAEVAVGGFDRPLHVGGMLGAALLALPLLSTRVLVSWHGWFHAALTEQIAAHGLPAANPGLAGEPLDYHWAFHAIPALLAETAAIDPLRALLGLNVAWIAVAALGAAELARALGLARALQRLAPLALFGALNTAAPLVLLYKQFVFGSLPSNPWDRGEWIDWLAQRAIPRNDADVGRVPWDVRASCFAKEFLDASGMATGLVLVVLALALAVEGARAPGRRTWLLAPLTLLIAFVYPPLLPCVVAAAAALALVHLIPGSEPAKARRSFAFAFVTACALALLLARPYLEAITSRERFVSGAKLAAFVEFKPGERLDHHVKWFAIFAALLPFLVPAATALWRRRRDAATLALLLAGAANVPLVLAVRMQQGTEYKFLYTGAIALAPVALLGLDGVLARLGPASRRLLLAASALYFAGPTAVFLAGALTSGHFKEEALALHGRTVTPLPTRPADEALEIVRRELPADTILVADTVASDKSPNNDAFEPAALAARDLYLADDRELTRRLAAFDERARIVECLLGSHDVAAATEALKPLHRPVALLLTPYVFAAEDPGALDDAWRATPFPAAGWHLLDHRGDAVLLYLPAVR